MRPLIALLLMLFLLLPAPARANEPQDWNDGGIDWQPYEAGLEIAQQAHKPICLVLYAAWCPHCRNYAQVFRDPHVVEDSRNFVMIREDVDQRQDLSEKYGPDGHYIPRTFFLSSDGVLDTSLIAEERTDEESAYFYNESNPASILAGMTRALEKFQPAPAETVPAPPPPTDP